MDIWLSSQMEIHKGIAGAKTARDIFELMDNSIAY